MIKIKKIIVITFFVFLLVLNIVNAVEIKPGKELSSSLCIRETDYITTSLKNNLNDVKSYDIRLSGDAASWSTVVPTNLILAQGEEKQVYVYITPSQNVKAGNYILLLDTKSGDDVSSIKYLINVKECYGVNLFSDQESVESCPGDTVKYNVKVTNNGEKADVFDLSVSNGASERVTLNEDSVSLEAGGSKDVVVFVNSPVDDGNYGLELNAVSKSSSASNSLDLNLKVKPCYDFVVNSEETSIGICERSLKAVPLSLTNVGSVGNKYQVALDGPVWVRLEDADLDLNIGESSKFNLVAAPDYGVNGNFSAKLIVNQERGDLKSETNFNFEVRKCHGVDVEFNQEEVDVCETNKNLVNVLVKNSGEFKKSYSLSLDAPSWVSLVSEPLVFLKSGKEVNLTLEASPPKDLEYESYSVKLNAFTTDESSKVDNDVDEVILNVKKLDECYKPVLESEDDVTVNYDSSAVVAVNVWNYGLSDADYFVTLSGDAINFVNANPVNLHLKSGSNETIYLYVAPTIGVNLGKHDLNFELNLANGPFLIAKKINFFVTDGSVVAETTDEVSKWNKFKNWFGRNFRGDQSVLIKFLNFVIWYKWYLVSAVTLGILLILIFYFGVLGKIVDFFDEDFEDEKPRKNRR